MRDDDARSGELGDEFDELLRRMDGLTDVVMTKATTVTVKTALGLKTQDWIIQTCRQSERDPESGAVVRSRETVFARYMDATGSRRFVIPDEILRAISRQHDALTVKNQRTAARAR